MCKSHITFFKYVCICFVLFLSSAVSVVACTCRRASTCERFNFGGMIFVGKAISIEQEKKSATWVNEVTVFEISELFSGEKVTSVRITNKVGGFSCSYEFTVGQTYLVFAGGNKTDGYGTGFCSGNLPIEYGAREVAELRQLSKSHGNGRLQGTVLEEFRKRSLEKQRLPLKDAVLNITHTTSGQKFTARTNESGRYEVAVPPGKYRIEPATPAGAVLSIASTDDEQPGVIPGGCFESFFVFSNASSIKGRLVDGDGNPIPNVRVELVSADEKSSYLGGMSDDSKENGEFSIEKIPAGKYTLSINFNSMPEPDHPFPTTFYPNGRVRTEANVIEFGIGTRITDLMWKLPKRLSEESIGGKVTMEDGTPVANAEIKLFDMAFPGFYAGCHLSEVRLAKPVTESPVVSTSFQLSGSACDLRSDGSGMFKLKAYSERTYRLTASLTKHIGNDKIEYSAESEPFTLTGSLSIPALVLKKK